MQQHIVPSVTATQVARILVVDDHSIVRLGLRAALGDSSIFRIHWEADDYDRALEIARIEQPDLCIVDVSLQGRSGLDLVAAMRKIAPKTRILVFSMHDETIYAEHAVRAGALGYLMKGTPVSELIEALHRVLEGEIALSNRMARRFLNGFVGRRRGGDESPRMERLSARELEVLEMIGRGFSTRRIAETLFVSVKTIETHRARIKKKLSIETSIDLVRHATQWLSAAPSADITG